jgi:hypothetical protein
MVNASKGAVADLAGLKSTSFDLCTADLNIVAGDADCISPQITFTGEQDAFEHRFTNGTLTVNEKEIKATTKKRFFGRNIVRGAVSVSCGSISVKQIGGRTWVNGVEIGCFDGKSEPRKIDLVLPPDYAVESHYIDGVTGSLLLEKLEAKLVKVSLVSGGIALRSCGIEAVDLETNSGSVKIESLSHNATINIETLSGDVDVNGAEADRRVDIETTGGDVSLTALHSKQAVDIATVGGDVKINNSSAKLWQIDTTGGDITTKQTTGELNASSLGGKVRNLN